MTISPIRVQGLSRLPPFHLYTMVKHTRTHARAHAHAHTHTMVHHSHIHHGQINSGLKGTPVNRSDMSHTVWQTHQSYSGPWGSLAALSDHWSPKGLYGVVPVIQHSMAQNISVHNLGCCYQSANSTQSIHSHSLEY